MPMIPRLIAAAVALTAPTPSPIRVDSAAEVREDGWVNTASGLGVSGVDKASAITFGATAAVDRVTLGELYRFDGIAAKIIDRPVWDSVRRGWSIDVQGEEDSSSEPIDKELADALQPLDLRTVYSEARKWARLYGDALVIAGLDDVVDGDLEQPVLRYGAVNWLEVVAAGYGGPVQREYADPADPSKVTMWVINPSGKNTAVRRVHPDRVHLVRGVPLPDELARFNDCWDDSVIQRVWSALSRVATADGTGVTFLSERQYPVWKVNNLKGILSGKNGAGMMARFEAMTVAKSIYKAIVLDKGNEEFDVLETSASGISDLLNIYPNRVAAVSNIPVTILYGTSPGGLNATGESDFQGYYDFVEGSEQAEHLEPFLSWVTTLVMEGDEGPTRGEVMPFAVNASPLSTPTEKETAETRAINANTDAVYIGNGVVSADEVRDSRYGGDVYGTEIVLTDTPDVAQVAAQMAQAAGIEQPVATGASAADAIPTAALAGVDPVVGVPEAATILNGAQITSLLSVTAEVTAGNVPPSVAFEALKLLGVAPETAQSMVDASASFTPTTTPDET